MKTQIPEALKADVPQTTWGRILTATPVIMTVVATLLAGLASSEMTRAQYSRSLAAQQQSKAGDQWSFFQAKRLRSTVQSGMLDLLRATAEVHPLAEAWLRAAQPEPAPPTFVALLAGRLPEVPAEPILAPGLKQALDLVEAAAPEAEFAAALGALEAATLDGAVRAARERAEAFDSLTAPVNREIERLDQWADSLGRERVRDFTAARLRYAAARYDAEARLNQAVARLIELQVRHSNLTAERHHRRSQRFFFGMLGAQAAVIVSTFSLAARQRSMLWTLAAAVGLLAVLFAIYVYFWV